MCELPGGLLFSLSVMSTSLWPHGLQHARPPCPSPFPEVYPGSPLHRWCHPAISSSVTPFSSCLQSFQASGSFLMSQLFPSGGQSIGASASASAIKVVSSAYLRLLTFLPAILIPDCDSSSLAFHMMYSTYKLNKHSENIQPWHSPFPIWTQSIVPCLVLTVASWAAYRFLRRQVR